LDPALLWAKTRSVSRKENSQKTKQKTKKKTKKGENRCTNLDWRQIAHGNLFLGLKRTQAHKPQRRYPFHCKSRLFQFAAYAFIDTTPSL
jgi:hypothetical protein